MPFSSPLGLSMIVHLTVIAFTRTMRKLAWHPKSREVSPVAMQCVGLMIVTGIFLFVSLSAVALVRESILEKHSSVQFYRTSASLMFEFVQGNTHVFSSAFYNVAQVKALTAIDMAYTAPISPEFIVFGAVTLLTALLFIIFGTGQDFTAGILARKKVLALDVFILSVGFLSILIGAANILLKMFAFL